MKRNALSYAVVLSLPIFLFVATTARAQSLMDSTGGSSFAEVNETQGYQFTTSVPFLITDFGMFDFDSDGLDGSHPITLYSNAGVPITSATIAAGTGTPLLASSNTQGGFRTVDVPDFTLPAGTYVIGAFMGPNNADGVVFLASANPAIGVTFNEARLASGDAFPSITNNAANTGYIGPTLVGSAIVVPEANAGLLASVALPVLGFVASRRRR